LNWGTITVDHVMPECRGGPTTWLNCVAACKACNNRKDQCTPEEAGMKLLKKPSHPTALHFWDAARSDSWHVDWDALLPAK
jgi:5-methylcytosine-specific restriction endonuclease McrA